MSDNGLSSGRAAENTMVPSVLRAEVTQARIDQ